MERKLDAAQETIIDQQQTIDKFRELVRHLQSDITDLRQRGESLRAEAPEATAASMASQSHAMMSLSQFKTTAIRAHSRVRGSVHKCYGDVQFVECTARSVDFTNFKGLRADRA